MIEILRLSDLTKAAHYPQSVVDAIRQSVTILDEAYGIERTRDGDGGLMMIAEMAEEVQKIIQSLPWGDVPEYVEAVHSDYIRSMYLINNDRSIEVYLPKEWATQAMKEAMLQ